MRERSRAFSRRGSVKLRAISPSLSRRDRGVRPARIRKSRSRCAWSKYPASSARSTARGRSVSSSVASTTFRRTMRAYTLGRIPRSRENARSIRLRLQPRERATWAIRSWPPPSRMRATRARGAARAGTRLRQACGEPPLRRCKRLRHGARSAQRPHQRSRRPLAHDAGQRQLPVSCPRHRQGQDSGRLAGAKTDPDGVDPPPGAQPPRPRKGPGQERARLHDPPPVDLARERIGQVHDQLGAPVGHHALRRARGRYRGAGNRPHALDGGAERGPRTALDVPKAWARRSHTAGNPCRRRSSRIRPFPGATAS